MREKTEMTGVGLGAVRLGSEKVRLPAVATPVVSVQLQPTPVTRTTVGAASLWSCAGHDTDRSGQRSREGAGREGTIRLKTFMTGGVNRVKARSTLGRGSPGTVARSGERLWPVRSTGRGACAFAEPGEGVRGGSACVTGRRVPAGSADGT